MTPHCDNLDQSHTLTADVEQLEHEREILHEPRVLVLRIGALDDRDPLLDRDQFVVVFVGLLLQSLPQRLHRVARVLHLLRLRTVNVAHLLQSCRSQSCDIGRPTLTTR